MRAKEREAGRTRAWERAQAAALRNAPPSVHTAVHAVMYTAIHPPVLTPELPAAECESEAELEQLVDGVGRDDEDSSSTPELIAAPSSCERTNRAGMISPCPKLAGARLSFHL
eukprot:4061394-Pleurochrysis_carterae.AAC.2